MFKRDCVFLDERGNNISFDSIILHGLLYVDYCYIRNDEIIETLKRIMTMQGVKQTRMVKKEEPVYYSYPAFSGHWRYDYYTSTWINWDPFSET